VRGRTWLAVLTAVALLAPAIAAGPAQARITRWDTVATGLDPAVGLAGNLNSTVVAAVAAGSGHVISHDVAGSSWTDLGRPSAAPVRQVALSADEVYAVDAGNAAFPPR
jgi:hypothetical protein